MTFRQSLTRSFNRMCFTVAGFSFLVAFSMFFTTEPVSVERPRVDSSPYTMIEECESAATGDLPGRALIQRASDGGSWVTSDRLIGKAMDDALGGKDWKNVRVIAFCK